MNKLWSTLIALFVALSTAAPALAQQADADEVPWVEQLDAKVGQYLVGPMATVMFADVVFWDNHLALGEGVGALVNNEQITSYSDEGYVYQHQYTLDAPVQEFAEGTKRTFGSLTVAIRNGSRLDDGVKTPTLIGAILPQTIDLAVAGLEAAPEDEPDATAIVAVNSLAPFSVRVDRRTAQTVAADIMLPVSMVPPIAGATVLIEDGLKATLIAQGEDGSWTALGIEKRVDATPLPNPEQAAMPIVVLWLVLGAIFFTFRMSFVNLWGFVHAIRVTAGQYDNPEDEGEISHFQALSSALSATVGLGNIAGVAIAISAGGPGAIFWMIIAGFLGMSSKFVECTLGQMYRVTRPDGTVSGGPMHYLDKGLAEIGLAPVGKISAWMFAILCVGGSLGGGNMFQANQSFAALANATDYVQDDGMTRLIYGLVLAGLVGVVIIGGIKRIAAAASMIVPVMCVMYLGAGLFIVLSHADAVPAAIGAIVGEAFSPQAGFGGLLGVLAQGFKRASFSSEAGVGSASIAHSAAQTPYPVREGIVALLEPFIDTIVVCATTGIVLVVTGVYKDPEAGVGVVMTASAFGQGLWWFPYVLTVAVVMFAFSTMISWSYYGEQAATWMFGEVVVIPYRVCFLGFVVLGSLLTVGNVTDFSDMMILGMAFPNILGAVLLSGKVKTALDEYWAKLKAGEFDQATA